MVKEKLEEVIANLAKFKNLYDAVRLVDPIEKISFTTIQGGTCGLKEETCYSFWEREMPCEQCIAMKAYTENDCFFKIENRKEKIFLVTACPFIEEDSNDSDIAIVEMLKDIAKKGYIVDEGIGGSARLKTYLREINDKAVIDELTGLYNRRYINEMLPVDINKSILFGYLVCVIMADIDFFKKMNDTYGHTIGDKVLRDFANILKKAIRKGSDWAARYGGDEFLIVANGTDSEGGYKLAEKIRRLVEEELFEYGDIKIKITASFGVYCIKNIGMDVETFIELADKNLYEAKRSGRNRTIGCM